MNLLMYIIYIQLKQNATMPRLLIDVTEYMINPPDQLQIVDRRQHDFNTTQLTTATDRHVCQ